MLWREHRLLVVDANHQIQTLFAQDGTRAVMSRVLPLDHGQVVLALDDELFVFPDTGFGQLTAAPGPAPTAPSDYVTGAPMMRPKSSLEA